MEINAALQTMGAKARRAGGFLATLDGAAKRRALETMADALKAAHEIGYPVMLKASMGGGGKVP